MLRPLAQGLLTGLAFDQPELGQTQVPAIFISLGGRY